MRRRGRGQGQRLLYWFRTPPGVRVGRAPIEEQAMRLLEQHNPEIDFDWLRLLKEAPQDHGGRRDRDPRERDRRERRDGRESRFPRRPRPLDTTAAAVPPARPQAIQEANADVAEQRAEAHADLVLETVENSESLDASDLRLEASPAREEGDAESVAVTHGEPLAADHTEYVEYAEASAAHAHAEPAEPREPVEPEARGESVPTPAEARLGADGLTRLRARYVQIVTRLAAKPMDDGVRAELNARVERLNPDAWRTADEVAAALEQYEVVFESLRAEVGHHAPRRR